MNDQRQVIFSQRLKILKENNINEILKDFFDEVLVNLNQHEQIFRNLEMKKAMLQKLKI